MGERKISSHRDEKELMRWKCDENGLFASGVPPSIDQNTSRTDISYSALVSMPVSETGS